MRDYPNGGFFFIDAAPIYDAGETGITIPGFYQDCIRAGQSGKVFVLTGYVIVEDGVAVEGSSSITVTAEFGSENYISLTGPSGTEISDLIHVYPNDKVISASEDN